MNRQKTLDLIKKHEGVRFVRYLDTTGHLTIGVGFNLQREGARARINAVDAHYDRIMTGEDQLTERQIHGLLAVDLDDAIRNARVIVCNFDEHPDPVKAVIVDMVFNLGAAGFAKFTKTIQAFEVKDYCAAAAQMAQSLWCQQVPTRAAEDIAMVMEFCRG